MDILQGLDSATLIFKTVALLLIVSVLTIIFRNAYDTRKEILRRKENYKREQKQVERILNEIEVMQIKARYIYENAKSEHDKVKALYAYQHVSECLKSFKPIKVKNREVE